MKLDTSRPGIRGEVVGEARAPGLPGVLEALVGQATAGTPPPSLGFLTVCKKKEIHRFDSSRENSNVDGIPRSYFQTWCK